MDGLFKVGVITSTHGIKGEVKVFPTTDDVKRFKKGIQLILETGKEQLNLEVEGVKFFKQFVILKFKGIDDINQIEKYRRKELFVTRENAVKLGMDEYFIADLIGLSVIDEEGNPIGMLEDVMETGANDVYVVKMAEEKEVLIPAIKQCILEVNVKEGFVKVRMMEGLL